MLPFEQAWREAWNEIIWPHDTVQRRQWKGALMGTKREWCAAYDLQPTLVGRMLEGMEAALHPPEELDAEEQGYIAA